MDGSGLVMRYIPFKQQKEFFLDKSRIRCLFSAKRSGKSEICYLDTIQKAEKQPGYIGNGIDPYECAIIAPTDNMLRGLVWPKFRAFAKPFEREFVSSSNTLYWKSNNSKVLGFSGEKIARIEGRKLSHVHITEAFQMTQGVFLEALARVADTKGTITIDGSLGPNLPNPKNHWLYKTFIEKQFPDSRVWEWATADNPHFPKDELERMEQSLDPRTFRQMFKIDWDVPGTSAVYDEFDESNLVSGYVYDKTRETYIVIDWGWAHRLVALFFQYDRKKDTVYLFDEISASRMRLDALWERLCARIKANGIEKVTAWACDIAGNQEREQTGYSNVQWFRNTHGISFKFRSSAVTYGIPLVRSYIHNGMGQRRFFVDSTKCPRTIDGLKNYKYQEKNGEIVNENPIKKDDDEVDAVRYFWVNFLDTNKPKDPYQELNRFSFAATLINPRPV